MTTTITKIDECAIVTISDVSAVKEVTSMSSKGINNLSNYYHVVKDSQFITDLGMLLHYLKHKTVMNEEDVKYTIISIENTIKNGYKLVKDKKK